MISLPPHIYQVAEFGVVGLIFVGVFVWGLVTGKTAMKPPFRATRATEPVRFWIAQGASVVFCLFCFGAAAYFLRRAGS